MSLSRAVRPQITRVWTCSYTLLHISDALSIFFVIDVCVFDSSFEYFVSFESFFISLYFVSLCCIHCRLFCVSSQPLCVSLWWFCASFSHCASYLCLLQSFCVAIILYRLVVVPYLILHIVIDTSLPVFILCLLTIDLCYFVVILHLIWCPCSCSVYLCSHVVFLCTCLMLLCFQLASPCRHFVPRDHFVFRLVIHLPLYFFLLIFSYFASNLVSYSKFLTRFVSVGSCFVSLCYCLVSLCVLFLRLRFCLCCSSL